MVDIEQEQPDVLVTVNKNICETRVKKMWLAWLIQHVAEAGGGSGIKNCRYKPLGYMPAAMLMISSANH